MKPYYQDAFGAQVLSSQIVGLDGCTVILANGRHHSMNAEVADEITAAARTELRLRAAAFEAEIARRHGSLPQKAFAICGALFALLSLGMTCEFSSAWFLVPTSIVVVLMTLAAVNSVCVRLNHRDAKRELSRIEAGR